MARVWRDGQRHTVHIYRLLTTGLQYHSYNAFFKPHWLVPMALTILEFMLLAYFWSLFSGSE